MSERDDGIVVNNLRLTSQANSSLRRIIDEKGVSKTRVVNNAIQTEGFLIDAQNRGMRIFILEPGAVVFRGRVFGRVFGEFDMDVNYQKVESKSETGLPQNVIPFRPKR